MKRVFRATWDKSERICPIINGYVEEPAMPALSNRLKKIQEDHEKSLWEGPCSNTPNGGITQSMLNSFLVCRERFRVKYILGLQPQDTFNHRLGYGSMWHACEESLAAQQDDPWARLDQLTVELCKQYPLQQQDILHWYEICKVQFPAYVDYWAQHEDVTGRTPLLQEEVFCVPYVLSSGRTVCLRGKFDSVDLIDGGIWLQENKTKGDIDAALLQRQLTFDLQTMFYLVALQQDSQDDGGHLAANEDQSTGKLVGDEGRPLVGVRYNVIRRPLSGGKGSIRQKKNQTQAEFYQELGDLIAGAVGQEWGMPAGESYFFMRWKVGITPKDVEAFKQQFLNPILEQLCDWWESLESWIDGDPWPSTHFRMPYGIYSPLYDGRPTEVDEYLATGSTVGLHRAESLFKELA